jgi:DNA polymerase III alpha subunit (gram-positive type)
MSEENNVVEEAVAENAIQEVEVKEEFGGLIAESKKYRTRAQTAEAELTQLKDSLKLQDTKRLEEKEEYKSLYESMKIENDKLKPIVDNFQVQEQQRREHLLSQLSEEDQNIYEDLSTIKLEKHVERLSTKKVQINDAKEVTSSGKFAQNTRFSDLSVTDRKAAQKNPKLWQQIVDGYKNTN